MPTSSPAVFLEWMLREGKADANSAVGEGGSCGHDTARAKTRPVRRRRRQALITLRSSMYAFRVAVTTFERVTGVEVFHDNCGHPSLAIFVVRRQVQRRHTL